MTRRVLSVVGARPNFMKIGPLLAAWRRRSGDIESILVHTGQHYDREMSDIFFEQLGLPRPDLNLNVGPGSQAAQTGAIMIELERAVAEIRPDLIVAVGDVNSTLAAALVAAKAGLPLAHVEAGLRSFDRRMPEEVNRVVTDALATYLFATEQAAVDNLRHEGVEASRVFLVGNVMIDTLVALKATIERRGMAGELGLPAAGYGVVTLHRPANVDDPGALGDLVDALQQIARDVPLVFPVHPRTADRLRSIGILDRLSAAVRLLGPLPYVEFLSLVEQSRLVLTDSGGVQEETTFLGIPCLTIRDNTERPVTVSVGTNRIVGTDPAAVVEAARAVLSGTGPAGAIPPLWDGAAAERIATVLDGLDWRAYATPGTNPAAPPVRE